MNIREQYATLLAELRELREKARAGTLSEEEMVQFDEKVVQARALKVQIEELERREGDADFLQAEDQRVHQSSNQRASGLLPRNDRGTHAASSDNAEHASIARRFIESEQFKEFRRDGHRGAMRGNVEIRSFFYRHTPHLMFHEGMDADQERDLRALVAIGGLPTDWVAPFRVPGVFTPDLPDFNVRSVFLNGQTDSGVIQFYRQLTTPVGALFVSEATATTGASGLKPESSLTWERDTAPVETLAHWVPVTTQTLEDDAQMQGVIEGQLIDGLRLVEDDALLNGNGTPPNISGLLDISGTQALNAAYFTANPVQDAGQPNEDLNRLLRGRRLVRQVGRARPSFVLIHPADMERQLSLTDANRQYMIAGGPFANGGISTIWRLPAIETEALDEGTAIVGDGRMAAVWDRMQATVKVGTIDDQFVRNMQTILAEERLAFAVYRPPAFAIVTLTSA